MYEFSPISPRVARVRHRYRETKPKVCMERFRLVTEFYKANLAMPPMIKRAKSLLNICENIPFLVNEDEVIVGELGSSYRCSALYPEYAIGWMFDEIRSGEFFKRPLDPYDIDPQDVEYFMQQEDFWRKNDLSKLTTEALPPEFSDIVGNGVVTFRDKEVAGGPVGHFCANYDKVIREGFGAIKADAQARLDEIKGKLYGNDAEKEQFYRAVTICADAMIVLAKRYAAEVRRQAGECTDPARKAELTEMAEGLDWIMENPARTFLEAVQAMFLYQIGLSHDGNLHGLSFGRVDQYLGSYYEADLAAGRITRERAQEIIDLFCLKVAEMNKIWSSIATQSASGYTSGQLITIGGVTRDGNDTTNEVSYMLLEASRRLKLHDPPMSLRIHEGTPDRLWDLAIESTRVNGGVPTFESDKVIVPALVDRGMTLESARNYCLIGCVEPGGCGDDWPACGGPGQESFWRIPSALLLAINNGTNPMPDWGGAPMRLLKKDVSPPGSDGHAQDKDAKSVNRPQLRCAIDATEDAVLGRSVRPGGRDFVLQQPPPRQTGLATGYLYDMKSFDEVKEALKRQIEYFIDWQVAFTRVREIVARHYMPLPIVSATVDGCLENGKDVMWGGAKFNGTGFAGVGIGTVIDSLATIKYAVFDEKLCTARELYDAVMSNWEGEGQEHLRRRLLREVPHYGNDLEYADEIAEWLSKVIADKVRSCVGPRGNHWNAGLYPVATHVLWGKLTWATPDGRHTGEPLSDGISPIQCLDTNGPISTLKSALRIDHRHNANGTLLNMKFHPKALEGGGKEKLVSLIQTYFDLDGMELQFNITDAETLRKAQEHPEEYKDLVVRIAGFSSYFVELHKDMQDDVIKRTELELA